MDGHDYHRCGGGQEMFIKNEQEVSNHTSWTNEKLKKNCFDKEGKNEKLKTLMLHIHMRVMNFSMEEKFSTDLRQM